MHGATQLDMDFRETAQRPLISLQRPRTIQELLDHISECDLASPHLQNMLRSTAAHITQCLGKPLMEIQISQFADALPEFGTFLKERRFKRNSIRSYLNYARILLQKARDLGWNGINPEVEAAWQPILAAIPAQNWRSKIRGIVIYGIRRGIKPQDFGELDLEDWAEWMLKQRRAQSYVRCLKGGFRSFVFRNGFRTALSEPYPQGGKVFRTKFDDLPEPLRSQIDQLLEWKVAKLSKGRPERYRHRPVTAKNFRDMLCRIAGFLEHVQGKRLSTLEELLTEQTLRDFVEWSINKRQVKGYYFISWFGMLHSSVRMYPPLKYMNFDWLRKLIEELPSGDAEIQKQEAKVLKWVGYDILCQIPARLREERLGIENRDNRRAALLSRNELLMTWLTVLPWRQRNLRECKLANKDDGGNLFKAPISQAATVAKPRWVDDAVRKDPREAFWQFFFRAEETKTAHQVHAVIPRQLISVLEEYLERYRPLLVNGKDPQTVFLNDFGQPLSSEGVFMIVGNITRRFAGRRVNPHLFRDILAVRWLEDHPEDYLTVSKILWHRNIQTTLRIYGRNFDESHGVRRMEEWLDQRGAGRA